MNTFGTIFRTTIFGESHGEYVGINIDGCPAGLPLTTADFVADIERRKPGAKGTTTRIETDIPKIISGVFNNKTTGAPITILFENTNTKSTDYEKRDVPRPGHADFVALKKFGGFEDYRGGGHFSGRLTVCLVAAGVIAKKLLALKDIHINANLTAIGGEADLEKGLQKAIDASKSIRVRFMDHHKYVSGQWYDETVCGDGADLRLSYGNVWVIQNNFIASKERKVERFKRWGHWFLDDRGECKPFNANELINTLRVMPKIPAVREAKVPCGIVVSTR